MNVCQLWDVIEQDEVMKLCVKDIIAADRLPDQLTPGPVGYIVNTDVWMGPGKHGIAFYVDKANNAQFFDRGKQ